VSPQCKYFEICQLPFCGTYKEDYCALHHPRSDTILGEFKLALKDYLERGKSDFSYVTFPEQLSDFTNCKFLSLLP
jgi:hypothetical protein